MAVRAHLVQLSATALFLQLQGERGRRKTDSAEVFARGYCRQRLTRHMLLVQDRYRQNLTFDRFARLCFVRFFLTSSDGRNLVRADPSGSCQMILQAELPAALLMLLLAHRWLLGVCGSNNVDDTILRGALL